MNIASFGNFFGPDTLIIFLVILLLFGAKKLPELAKGMGQAVREFSKAKDDIEREVNRPPAEEAKALYEPKSDAGVDITKADDPHHGAANDLAHEVGHDVHHETPAAVEQKDQNKPTQVA